MRLEEELKVHGSDMDAQEFRERLMDVFAATCPGQTVEDLLCDWRRSRDFCQVIRGCARLDIAADTFIARTLLNMRKDGTNRVNLYQR